ncbi:ABC transporter substrate-binding protein [Streptomyces sp. HSW2009]|uniref:ABC transporter substrate-binding protein n=1 Tax=Streptomyces sp. HSW2009 TaxID=3142890 RepID=UPI0032F02B88
MTRSAIPFTPVKRRAFLGGLAGAAAALGLAACGVSDSGDDEKDTKESKGGKEGGEQGTRSIKTDNGTVTVPTKPERVIACENWDTLMLLDLGIVPIGIPDGIANAAALPADVYQKLRDVKTIGVAGTPNSQAIGALKPDLIVDQFYKDKTAPLKTIAPVAYYNWSDSGALWYEQLDKIADAVNRRDALTDAKSEYRRRLAEVKGAYAQQIAKTTWAPLSGGQNGAFFLGSPLLTVMRDLGLKIGAKIAKDESGFVQKSYEELEILDDCDVLLYPQLFDGKAPALTQQLLDNKVWKGVRAVKAGHAFPIQHYTVGSYRWANGAVDEIEKILKKL